MLTTDWYNFEYAYPSNKQFTVNFLNDNGPRDVWIEWHEDEVTDLIPEMYKIAEWGCGTSNEKNGCNHLRDGKLAWGGPYTWNLKPCGINSFIFSEIIYIYRFILTSLY